MKSPKNNWMVLPVPASVVRPGGAMSKVRTCAAIDLTRAQPLQAAVAKCVAAASPPISTHWPATRPSVVKSSAVERRLSAAAVMSADAPWQPTTRTNAAAGGDASAVNDDDGNTTEVDPDEATTNRLLLAGVANPDNN